MFTLATQLYAGESAPAAQGEAYTLHVPPSELFDASSADFCPSHEGPTTCVLHLQRAFATVAVTLKSVHATTPHWSADLPLPTSIAFRIVHSALGAVVAAGSTDVASRARFDAAEFALLVGEEYAVTFDATDTILAADHGKFMLHSRVAEVTTLVRRRGGEVEIGCRSARAGTGHWSARLPLPDGISFNIYHKGLGCSVTTGATSSARGNTCLVQEDDALFIGETYICEVPASVNVRATSREFVVTAEPQHVAVLVERASGQAIVHLNTPASLPLPEGVQLQLVHKGLEMAVVPPISIEGDRSELFGDDALLVGEVRCRLPRSASHSHALHAPHGVHATLMRPPSLCVRSCTSWRRCRIRRSCRARPSS